MDLICRYCGKSILNIENKSFRSKKEAEEYATLSCTCDEGESYRKRINADKELTEIINDLEYLELSDNDKEFIKQCGIFVLERNVKLALEIKNVKLKFLMKKHGLEFELVQTNKQVEII